MKKRKVIKKIVSSMGTINEIEISYDDQEENNVKDILDKIENYLIGIDNKWSIFKKDSEISFLNRSVGNEVKISEDTYTIIKESIEYSELTDGAFDITIHPLSVEWKKIIKNGKVPNNLDITNLLTNVNYKDIVLCNKTSIMLNNKSSSIDLGGIAKGYVLNEIIKILKNNGFNDALINLGGTISSIGEKRVIGIRNPFTSIKNGNSEIFAEIDLKDQYIVTSGIYEQCIQYGNKIYHHIINPFTGFPTITDIISVTLVGNNASMLDALATSAFVMGIEKTINILKNKKIEALIVTKNGNIFVTENLKNNIRFINSYREV